MRRKVYRISCFAAIFLFTIVSCVKDGFGPFPADVSFNISGRLLEGRRISCIDIDKKGNYCIGSESDLFYFNNGRQDLYRLDHPVLDVAIAEDASVWIGTNGGGLGHLTGKGITWYTKANSGLPRDYIRHVELAPDGTVWFSSCAHQLGGLGVFDGWKFSFFTPENSPLNQNVIQDINIDRDGVVYIATAGTVGRSNIYRIRDKKWDCLGDEEGMFYWIFSFTVSPTGTIYVIEDFSLSSYFCGSNNLWELSNNRWSKIETDDVTISGFFSQVIADQRGFCWIPGYDDNTPVLYVYNGNTWISSPADTFPGDFFTCMEVDYDNNIWLGTYSNGVFILRQ